jgi:4'-phosphopantetheinyl transferase
MAIPGVPWPKAASFSPADGVDVRHTNMDDHQPSWYLDFLTEEEIRKAERIRDSALSRYAIISRGFLRVVLGDRLGISPSDVAISTLKDGKPVLSTTMFSGLEFNVSHSHNILVMVVSEINPVGIDIEMIDPSVNSGQASSVAFSQDEREYLEKSMNPIADFYTIWTGKEAILKASGDGFAYPSRNFSVISSKKSSLKRTVTGEVTANRVCSLHYFSLITGFTGALATMYP